jgi:hypothetical protein
MSYDLLALRQIVSSNLTIASLIAINYLMNESISLLNTATFGSKTVVSCSMFSKLENLSSLYVRFYTVILDSLIFSRSLISSNAPLIKLFS